MYLAEETLLFLTEFHMNTTCKVQGKNRFWSALRLPLTASSMTIKAACASAMICVHQVK